MGRFGAGVCGRTAAPKAAVREENIFDIHEDATEYQSAEEGPRVVEDELIASSESEQDSSASDESRSEINDTLLEDMRKFADTFDGLSDRFRLIKRIGEGTFSTVYKAEDLLYEHYDNEWDLDNKEFSRWSSPPIKKRRTSNSESNPVHHRSRQQRYRTPQFVAIKKIYVTSSPIRIQNELELLYDLRGCDSVCPLITAFRHQDQVVAVLPYFRHADFREYFREFTVADMRIYFRSLFTALAAVHGHQILHRDIKPTNFLYDWDRRRGVLVDFGLAEREGTDSMHCVCHERVSERREKINSSIANSRGPAMGYPKNDSRPSRRANRAGTRGFRAPEVLFKCTDQSTKIDIWSAGVILLTILSRRFPFFNSADDVEAMIEIASIFGQRRMKACALLHGSVFECTIPTIGAGGYNLEKIILWSTCRTDKGETLSNEELQATRFLERCLELDPQKRISAEEALQHPFLAGAGEGQADEDEVEML